MSIVNRLIRLAKPMVDRVPVAAMAYRYVRDHRHLDIEPVRTPLGFKLSGNRAMESGGFEPEETAIVQRLLADAGVEVVINVGANIGYYCCLGLQAGKEVVAFEPIRRNVRFLCKNIQANHWEERIQIFPIALSDRVGVVKIFGGDTSASLVQGWAGISAHYVELVPASTMDLVLGERFVGRRCVVLVDVEGAERLMLEGATIMLASRPRPIWLVEIAVNEHQPAGVKINPHLLSTFERFWDHDYDAWTADRRLRRIEPIEVRRVMDSGVDTLGTHNFLFGERGRDLGSLFAR